MRFETVGDDQRPRHPVRVSLMDYIFRRLGLEYLPDEKRGVAGHQVDRRAKEAAQGAAQELVNGAAYGEAPPAVAGPRPEPKLIASRQPATLPLGWSRRAALLLVRLEDAAGRQLLRCSAAALQRLLVDAQGQFRWQVRRAPAVADTYGCAWRLFRPAAPGSPVRWCLAAPEPARRSPSRVPHGAASAGLAQPSAGLPRTSGSASGQARRPVDARLGHPDSATRTSTWPAGRTQGRLAITGTPTRSSAVVRAGGE
jgi:hypothetical protein